MVYTDITGRWPHPKPAATLPIFSRFLCQSPSLSFHEMQPLWADILVGTARSAASARQMSPVGKPGLGQRWTGLHLIFRQTLVTVHALLFDVFFTALHSWIMGFSWFLFTFLLAKRRKKINPRASEVMVETYMGKEKFPFQFVPHMFLCQSQGYGGAGPSDPVWATGALNSPRGALYASQCISINTNLFASFQTCTFNYFLMNS